MRERADTVAVTVLLWERQHVLEGLWATGFIPPQACLSQYGGDWLLNGSTWPYAFPLSRSDFTGLPSQHPPAVLYADPRPHPHSLLASFSQPIPYPQSNSPSWISSEWHPLNLPNYLSSVHTAVALFKQGGAEGPKAVQLHFLTAHLEITLSVTLWTLHCQVQNSVAL